MADRSNSRNRLRGSASRRDVAESIERGGIGGTCFSSNPLLRLALVKLKTLTGAASIDFNDQGIALNPEFRSTVRELDNVEEMATGFDAFERHQHAAASFCDAVRVSVIPLQYSSS